LPDDRATWTALQGWFGAMTSRGCGWRGWYSDSAMVLDGGLVAWCQGDQRREVWGILVDLPGKACAAMGDKLVPFLRWCLDHSGHVTRADLALDDRDGRLTRERIRAADANDTMVTRWRGDLDWHTNERHGEVHGWLVYIGSRKSDALIRIYDKASEQRRKGRDVAGPWVRLELECHGDFADALCREYFQKGSGAVIGQVNRRLRFVVPSATDSNVWRAAVADWWSSFVGSVQAGPSLVCGEAPECTVSRLAAFVERQAGPALVTIVKGAHGDLGQLLGILDRSACRLRPKHYAALALQGGA